MNDKNSARYLVLNSLIKVNSEESYSNILFNNMIKKSNLDARDTSFASKLFYGVLEKQITLDYIIEQYSKRPLKKLNIDIVNILRMGIYQIVYMDKVPDSAACNQSVKLARIRRKESATGFVNGILRSFIRNDKIVNLPDKNKDLLKYLEIKYSCPKYMIKSFIDDYGYDNATNMLDKLDVEAPMWIRVNNTKTSKMNLKDSLIEQGVTVEDSYICDNTLGLTNTGSIENNKSFKSGEFHIQNLSSQICCEIINPQQDETVYDVCAAPGGKSFTLAEIMNNKGKVISCDLHENKVKLIQKGATRMGLTSIQTQVRDASKNIVKLAKADKVLCDVPCSGFGAIKSKPEIRYRKGIKLDNLVNLQYIILCESAKLVKDDGLLFYSTCTLNKKENDCNVERFLKEHSEFTRYSIDKTKFNFLQPDEPDNQLTIFISDILDGFFISAFRKSGVN